jgi:hypothetical protein
MSGILEFFKYVYVTELAGIDYGEKCLKCRAEFRSLTTRNGKINLGDSCVSKCGIWHRVKRLIGRFKVKGKFEINTPTVITGRCGTAFMIDVADDGITLVAVLEGEVEVIDKLFINSIIINEGQQITIAPQKPLTKSQKADKNLLDELVKWKQNIINEKNIEELEMPENTVIELAKGRLNYTSL